MFEKWVKAASDGMISSAVFVDLSAAFDLVSPEILLKKLNIYGLYKSFQNWVKDYLTGRCQSVWIDHCYSTYLPCKFGVPEGSILGPLILISRRLILNLSWSRTRTRTTSRTRTRRQHIFWAELSRYMSWNLAEEIVNFGTSLTDHNDPLWIIVKMTNTSQDPPASSKAPN